MYVVDVAAGVVSALKDDGTSIGKVYELGGPEIFTVHELVCYFIRIFPLPPKKKLKKFSYKASCSMQAEIMYDMIREWPRYLKVPFPIAKVKTVKVDDDIQRSVYVFFQVLYISPTIFLLLLLLFCKNYSQLSFILWSIFCYLQLLFPPIIA